MSLGIKEQYRVRVVMSKGDEFRVESLRGQASRVHVDQVLLYRTTAIAEHWVGL